MALKQRVKALEKRRGHSARPVIVCVGREKAEAIAEWEAENGPLGTREPLVIAIQFIGT